MTTHFLNGGGLRPWCGLTVEGGVIWHDLRRTFATELRGRQVHEYDIFRSTRPHDPKRHGYIRTQHTRGAGRRSQPTHRTARYRGSIQEEGQLKKVSPS